MVRYYTLLLASTLLMASAFVVSKIFLNAGIHPVTLVASRFTLAGAVAVLWLFLRGDLQIPRTRRDVAAVLLVGSLQTALLFGTGFIAMVHLSAATISLLILTMPIWVVVLHCLVYRELPGVVQLVALGLGISGVVLIIGSGLEMGGVGDLLWFILTLTGAVSWAAATVFTKGVVFSVTGWSLNAWQMLVGGLQVGVIQLLLGVPGMVLGNLGEVLLFAWLVLPASILSFGFWFAALQLGGAGTTSGYLFLIPLFTALMSVPALGATFSPLQLLGGVAVGIAVWLMSRAKN